MLSLTLKSGNIFWNRHGWVHLKELNFRPRLPKLIRPQSEATGTVIIGILLVLAKNVGAKAEWLLCHESHVRITFSNSSLHDKTKLQNWNPRSRSAAAEVATSAALVMCHSMYTCGKTVVRTTLSLNIECTSGFLMRNANKQTTKTGMNG